MLSINWRQTLSVLYCSTLILAVFQTPQVDLFHSNIADIVNAIYNNDGGLFLTNLSNLVYVSCVLSTFFCFYFACCMFYCQGLIERLTGYQL